MLPGAVASQLHVAPKTKAIVLCPNAMLCEQVVDVASSLQQATAGTLGMHATVVSGTVAPAVDRGETDSNLLVGTPIPTQTTAPRSSARTRLSGL